ncbi:MAG: hypothetical protein NWE93_02075 [Candidatus Bathyarchaeota archaeon]|nr:hypothetical protein [Candidatus Bathyarchaeota archaeon]
MAASNATSTELGFAEFASTLISETLNAVVTSILTQEKQAAQMQQQAQQSAEQYAKENLTDDLVRQEVIRLFPASADNTEKSAVDAGEAYSRTKEGVESPAVFSAVGYRMTRGDLTLSQGKTVISTAGYANILAATRLTLAQQHLDIIKTVVARGIPRVYVDNGHIKSKLNLRFEAGTQTASSTTGSKIAGLGIRRVFAQPISASKPEFLTLKADVLSEVEITFKTVVP